MKTHFRFPDDHGSWARATDRCVGAGVCRRHGGGVMCPSYMVTLEEADCTRGRARLLNEMMRGEAVTGGWRSPAVRQALDLCLACKGCKGECPVQVDMATYKSEFLSHYYERRLRPRSAYAMGLIHRWARVASHMPGLVNWATHAPGLASIAKRLADIAPDREIPRFAKEPFTTWFRRRGAPERGSAPAGRVILWPDTFNNFFHPSTAQAAVEVLEVAGYRVELPSVPLCCGRPLYDWGMLTTAERLLHRVLDALKSEIEAGVPIVVLEPSCASVFRDELCNLMPEREDAKRLSAQTLLLSELLEQRTPNFRAPQLHRRAVVHAHCHHRSVLKIDSETKLLKQMGLDYNLLDSGCCGMAGSFGFERAHYDVSIRAGERVLLPAVRQAADDTLIITDGFSCREQIAQTTGRRAHHVAEVLRMGLTGGP